MNTKIIVVMIAVLSMFMTGAAAPTTEHYEGEYVYDGPNENLEATADWDFDVTTKPNRNVVIVEGEANAHLEYTYLNDEDYNEFIGGNVHVDGYAKFKRGDLRKADIYTNGNVYTGYEQVHNVAYETYYENGRRYTIGAYDMVERYEQGYEFEGYLKVRYGQIRPASYFEMTPYEQYIYDHSQRVVKSEFRNRNSLETGIVAYIGLPDGTVVESYTRTSTANGGAGTPMTVVVPGYTVGNEPWKSDPSRLHNTR